MSTSEHADAHGRIVRTTSTRAGHGRVGRYVLLFVAGWVTGVVMYQVLDRGRGMFRPLKADATLQHIELSERFEKSLPPDLLARIRTTQAKVDPTCSTIFDVSYIPDHFKVTYQQSKHDSAGMLTESCSIRKDAMAETFYLNVDYPDQR